jgi:Ion channel
MAEGDSHPDWRAKLRDPSLTLLLILYLVAIFFITPLTAAGFAVPRLAALILVFAAVSLVVLVSRTRFAVMVGIASLVASIGGVIIRERYPGPASFIFSAAGAVLALSALNWVVASAVFAPGRISFYRIQGAFVLYLNLAVWFSVLFRLIAELQPGAFVGFPSDTQGAEFESVLLYFSFTTITSTGYGDIIPVNPFARSLTNLEAVTGQLYAATVLARIVTLELEHRRR